MFYNPDTNDELRPGPHIGYAYSDLATYGELILEDDEYINEIFGCCSRQIDYLHIGTNKGNYIEFGRPDDKNRFRFRIPE